MATTPRQEAIYEQMFSDTMTEGDVAFMKAAINRNDPKSTIMKYFDIEDASFFDWVVARFCDNEEVVNSRFEVGTKVLCRIGREEWAAGHVYHVRYREPCWPPGQTVPYQVLLESGDLMCVPEDTDELCRLLVPPWWEEALSLACASLHVAPDGPQLEILREKMTKESVDDQDHEGHTALMGAVSLNWQEAVLELLALKADVNISDKSSKHPLHFAVSHGVGMMKVLIDFQADVNCQDMDPDFDPNCSSKSFGDRRAHRTPMHYACLKYDPEVLALLVNSGAKLDIQDSQFKTPLHLAIEEHNWNVVDALLQHKADVNLGNMESGLHNFPLMDAAKVGNRELTIKLIAARAEINKQGKQGMSALHLAARGGHTTIVAALLEAHADTMQESQCGTALHLAQKNGRLDLLKLLAAGNDTSAGAATEVPLKSLDAQERAALFIA